MKPANAAQLPGLPSVKTGNPALDRWMQAVTERLEVREGSRGNPNERVVTVRELRAMGFSGFGGGFGSSSRAGDVLVQGADGTYSSLTPSEFAESIRNSKLYRDLMKRLDDATRFDGLPDQVKAILLNDIAAEAAKRGADIQRLEFKLQSATESLAYKVDEVTASIGSSLAGVRETVFASATESSAIAGKVTQIQARINGVDIDPDDIDGTIYADLMSLQAAYPIGAPAGTYYQVGASAPYTLYRYSNGAWVVGGAGTSATIEQSMVASADRVRGSEAEYMVKLNAGGAVAGFGLSASEDPTGATSSEFIVQADKFAVVMPGLSQAVPFGVDANGVYINGNLRVSTGNGTALADIASGATGTSTAVAYAYKRSGTDLVAGWDATTTGPGAITWTFSSGAITTPATDALGNGWTKAIPTGTLPLYVTVCTAANTTPTDTVAATEWATPALLVQNGVDGDTGLDGLNVATAILYQRTATNSIPAAQTNTVTLTFATGGMTGMTAGWTTAIPDSADGAYLWITRATASATTPTDTLAAGEWSVPVLYTQDGANGVAGTRTAILDMYQWAAAVPTTFPAGSSTYTWETGQFTAPSTPNGWSLAPSAPVAGQTLYIARTVYADSSTDPTSSVTWSASVATPLSAAGTSGVNGQRVGFLEVYQWAEASPTTYPGGTSTYTWSTGAFTAPTTPNGWSLTPGAAVAGQVLWGISVRISNTDTAPTDSVIWDATTPYAVGAAGSDGASGARGSVTRYLTGSVWSDAAANAALPDGIPIYGDEVTISNGTNFVSVKYYNGGSWVLPGAVIDGSLLVSGTVTASKINSNGLSIRDTAGNIILSAGASLGASTFNIPGTVTGTPSGWLNSNIAISGGAISGIGTGAGTVVANNKISIGSNGALSGAGGGQVTIGGLGYTGALNANNTTVSSGLLYNNGASTGVKVDNSAISISSGAISGIGAGNGTAVANSAVNGSTLISNGVWAALPASGATVGATFGVNIGGQITSANASTYIASAAISEAMIGTLTASKITAGTFTGFTIKTAASGPRIEMGGSSYVSQIRGFDSTFQRITIDSSDGSVKAVGKTTSVTSSSFSSAILAPGITGSGDGLGAKAGPGVKGTSLEGHGIQAVGNTNKAPLFITPSTSKPTSRTTGDIMVFNDGGGHRLCLAVAGTWYKIDATMTAI